MVDLRLGEKKRSSKKHALRHWLYLPFIAKFNRASRTLSGSSFFTGLGGRVLVDDLLDVVDDDVALDVEDVEDAGCLVSVPPESRI